MRDLGPMARLAATYKVPIKRGRHITLAGVGGRVTSVRGGYVRAKLDSGRRVSFHPRCESVAYLKDDGETVLLDPSLCSKCAAAKVEYYHLCRECLPEGYRRIVDYEFDAACRRRDEVRK